MALAALTLLAASAMHFGLQVPLAVVTVRDPFFGAAIPEAILAVTLGLGAAAVLTRWWRPWPIGLATTLFTLLVVIYGLTITLRTGRYGDVAYHLTLVLALLVTIGLLFTRGARRGLAVERQAR